MQMTDFLQNVFKNCNQRYLDKLYEDSSYRNEAFQTPGSRSLTVMQTVVIGKSSDFCERVYKNCFIICGVSRGITHQKYNLHILNERF